MRNRVFILAVCLLMGCGKPGETHSSLSRSSLGGLESSDVGAECFVATYHKLDLPGPFDKAGDYSDLEGKGYLYAGKIKTISKTELILISEGIEATFPESEIIKIYTQRNRQPGHPRKRTRHKADVQKSSEKVE